MMIIILLAQKKLIGERRRSHQLQESSERSTRRVKGNELQGCVLLFIVVFAARAVPMRVNISMEAENRRFNRILLIRTVVAESSLPIYRQGAEMSALL